MSTRTLPERHRCAENFQTCRRGFRIHGNTTGPVSIFGGIFRNNFLHLVADCSVTFRGHRLAKLMEIAIEIEPTVGRAADSSDFWR
jgi:hypothetical protein